MPNDKLRFAILLTLALAPLASSHAEDAAIYCRLKGGSLVQLPADACAKEGGTLVSAAVAPAAPTPAAPAPAPATAPATAPLAAPAAAAAPAASVSPDAVKPTGNPDLDQAERQVVEILGKAVAGPSSSSTKPESIERSASFDGCRMRVKEDMHMDFGNIMTTRKNFRIDSTVDFSMLPSQAFGALGEISSRAGDLSGQAVYFEESRYADRKALSISVQLEKRGIYSRYDADGGSASLAGPRDYFWIVDSYGYPLDNYNNVTETYFMNKDRIIYIIDTPDDATRLLGALQKVSAMCGPQQAGAGLQKK